MRIGSLFSGYGGLDLAALQLFPGSQVWWHCEWDDAPSKILDHHWPGVPNYRDVTTVDWEQLPAIDVLTGGYPCQPFSAAGQRKGTNDERHLWPYVRQAIRVLRPRFTLLENVAGHRSMGFDRVLGDCAEDGLHVRWTSIRASDVGFAHHRERLFIAVTPNASGDGRERRQKRDVWSPGRLEASRRHNSDGCDLEPVVLPTPVAQHSGNTPENHLRKKPGRTVVTDLAIIVENGLLETGGRLLPTPSVADGTGGHANRSGSRSEELLLPGVAREHSVNWGKYEPAVRRQESLTRPAPVPAEPGRNGKPRLSPRFSEWLMGLPDGWVTDVPGVPRVGQLKAIGNGVCPPQAVAAFSDLLSWQVAS